jgi:hypothetical protein
VSGPTDGDAPAVGQPARATSGTRLARGSTTLSAVERALEAVVLGLLRERGVLRLADPAWRARGLVGRRLERLVDRLAARNLVLVEPSAAGVVVRLPLLILLPPPPGDRR